MNYGEILQKQKEFFRTHQTKDIDFRKAQLKKLKKILKENENLLNEAVYQDFKKSAFDTYTTELSFLYNSLDYYIKNLKQLAEPKSARTNLTNQIGFSKVHYEPFGNTLVIGAWNYPYQLTLLPAITAMAAGNTCLIKPSEVAENSMKAMVKIINENFAPEYIYTIEAGIPETTELLKLKFDKIFFTGSPKVGRIVYEAAAKNLTPVTLELGGKSPAIVTENADLDIAAKRIVWGKFLNAGQTCVAPDYILVHEKVKAKFIDQIKKYIHQFNYQSDSEHFCRIINAKNFQRIVSLMDQHKVILGGDSDLEKLYISPTVIDHVSWDDAIMQEEIFGPLMPIITYSDFQETIEKIISHEKPLAAYLFSNNKIEKEIYTQHLSFGGGCINDCVMHFVNEHLPIGGVGNSGIGNYHGEFGFETFSHKKAVMEKVTFGEPNLKYPPYTKQKLNILKKIM